MAESRISLNLDNNTPVSQIDEGVSIIPTNDSNLVVKSTPIKLQLNQSTQTKVSDKRLVEDIDGEPIYIKVSDFNENGTIRITGDYLQNYVDFPKYDLSPLKILSDITFKFILGIKETQTSAETIYYTSKKFYENELLSSYQNSEPYLVNNAIKQEKIVLVYLEQYKKKIESLRDVELKLPIQEIFDGGLLIERNLFMNSNYQTDSTQEFGVKANPTYNIDELVRYVDWVVSKPSNDYDNRLLDAREIGKWNEIDTQTEVDTTPTPTEPSTNVTTPPTNYQPIGRIGSYVGEIITTSDGDDYEWTGTFWKPFFGRNDYDGPVGGRF